MVLDAILYLYSSFNMADPLVLELGEIAIFDYPIEILSDSYNW